VAPAAPDARGWRLLLGAVASVGLVFSPITADVFMLPKLALFAIGVTAAGALLGIGWYRARVRPALSRSMWVAVGYLTAVLLSLAFSVAPRLAFVGNYQRYGGTLPVALMVLGAFLVAWYAAGDDTCTGQLAAVLAATGVAVGAYATLQRAGIDAFDFQGPQGGETRYPGSSIGNSNFAGGWLAISLPLVAIWGVRQSGRARLIGCAGAAVVVLGIWCTQSRGAMVATAVSVAVLAWALAPRGTPARRVAVGAATVVAGVVFALATLAIVAPAADRWPGPFARLDVLRSESAQVRHYEWSAAVRATVDRPILGHGRDTFLVVYPRHRSTADGAELGLLLSDKPHNIFLEHAVDMGITGLLAYLTLITVVVVAAARALRAAPTTDRRVLLAGFLAAFSAYLTQGFFSIDVPPLAIAGWLLIGALIALADPPRVRRSTQRERVVARSARVLAFAAVVALIVPWFVALAASFAQYRAERADGRRDLAAATIWYRRSVDWFPIEPAYHRALGFAAERRAAGSSDRSVKKRLFSDAIAEYTEAAQQQPGNVALLVDLARAHTVRAQQVDARGYGEADRYYGEAVDLDPHDWQLRELYALTLNDWANASGGAVEIRRRAAFEFGEVVRLKPSYFRGWINLGRVQLALGDLDAAFDSWLSAARISPWTTEVGDLYDAIVAAGGPTVDELP